MVRWCVLADAMLTLFKGAVAGGVSTKSTPILQWAPCVSPIPDTLDCSELQVPMDYDHPENGNVTLGLARQNATAASSSVVGNLIINPGGPGGSAVGTVVQQAEAEAMGAPYGFVSLELSRHCNIIGPDPRGVGLT